MNVTVWLLHSLWKHMFQYLLIFHPASYFRLKASERLKVCSCFIHIIMFRYLEEHLFPGCKTTYPSHYPDPDHLFYRLKVRDKQIHVLTRHHKRKINWSAVALVALPAPLLCLRSAPLALSQSACPLPLLSAFLSETRWTHWRCREHWRALWLWLWNCRRLAGEPRSVLKSILTTYGQKTSRVWWCFKDRTSTCSSDPVGGLCSS